MTTHHSFQPNALPVVPPLVRLLTRLIGGIAIGLALVARFAQSWPIIHWLGLSATSLTKGWIWQFLTFPFVAPHGLGLNLVFYLIGYLFAFRSVASFIYERIGPRPLLRFLAISTLLGGGLGSLTLLLVGGAPLVGLCYLLLPLLVGWMMIMPQLKMAKWAFVLVLGYHLVISGSAGQYAAMATMLGVSLTAYIYALIAWNTRSPFERTARFDDWVSRIGVALRRWWADRREKRVETRAKIFDFRTGAAVLSDGDFLIAIEEKIAFHGTRSLSRRERRRWKRLRRD